MKTIHGTFILEEGRTTPCCPFCNRYEHAGHADDCPICFAAQNQREHDLVRQMRMELHNEALIDDAEYAKLASEHGGVERLEDYDVLRDQLERARQELTSLNERAEAAEDKEGAVRGALGLPGGTSLEELRDEVRKVRDLAKVGMSAIEHAIDAALAECARQGCPAQVTKEARTAGLLAAKTALGIPAGDNYSGIKPSEKSA